MSISLEIRQRIHDLYHHHKRRISQQELADLFGISRSSVQRILRRDRQDHAPRTAPGAPGLVQEAELAVLQQFQQRHPDAFLHEYAAELKQRCGLEVSLQTIHTHLRRLNLTLKKTEFSLPSCSKKTGNRLG